MYFWAVLSCLIGALIVVVALFIVALTKNPRIQERCIGWLVAGLVVILVASFVALDLRPHEGRNNAKAYIAQERGVSVEAVRLPNENVVCHTGGLLFCRTWVAVFTIESEGGISETGRVLYGVDTCQIVP